MLTMVFALWVLLIVMSTSWLLYIFTNNIRHAFDQPLMILVLFLAILSFTLSMFFITQMLVDVRYEIKREREKQRNVKDIYRYNQTVEPPSIYT